MKRLLVVTGSALMTLFVAACTDADDDPEGGEAGAGGSSGASAGTAGASAGKGGSAGSSAGKGGSAGTNAGSAGTGAGEGGAGDGGTAGAGAGAGGDAGGSGGTGEAGAGGAGDARWALCPSADEFEDDASWPDTLEVTGDGVYCATFDESRTLKEELAKKALLRVTPGSYRLPASEREGLALPVCVAFGDDGVGVPAIPRSTTHEANSTGGVTYHRYGFVSEQPDPARRLIVELQMSLPDGEAPGFVLNGDAPDLFGPTEPMNGFALFESLEETFWDRRFDSCTHESSRLNRHEIAFDGGELTLDVRIGQSYASTEPGAFVAASGTFRGVAFTQTDYFKLVYRPAHHHFERDFAVLFDEPIEGACGIQILTFPADQEGVPPTAATVDCALDPIDALTVDSFTLTREPL